jgi:hypothetical protein
MCIDIGLDRVGMSPRQVYFERYMSVLDVYYGSRWDWHDHDQPCIETQARWANPANLGEEGVRELVARRKEARRFDLDEWLRRIFTLPIREPLPVHERGWSDRLTREAASGARPVRRE